MSPMFKQKVGMTKFMQKESQNSFLFAAIPIIGTAAGKCLITSASMCTSEKSMKHTMAAHSKFSFANLMVVFAMRLLFTCMKADSGQGTALAVSTRLRFATTLVLSMP